MIAFSSSQRKQLTCVDEAVGHVPQGKAERHSQECLHGQTVIAERRAIAGDSEKPAEAGDAISSTHPGTDACRAALTATEKYNCEILASIVTVVFDRRPGKKPSQPDALVRCKTATRSQPPSLCSRPTALKMSRDLAMGHSGASQNVGNQLRPGMSSVKLHAPPGGASSLSLAWGAEPADPVGRSGRRAAPAIAAAAPAPAAYAAPPAAAGPRSFSSGPAPYEPPPAYGAYAAMAPPPPAYGGPEYVAAPAPAAFGAMPRGSAPPIGGSGAVSSNAYASGASQNSGNFITDRPTTRVHAAPGGRSSIVLG